jgi:hypothetical protein
MPCPSHPPWLNHSNNIWRRVRQIYTFNSWMCCAQWRNSYTCFGSLRYYINSHTRVLLRSIW